MINKVILIGNLGAAPELRRLESGVAVARLSIATSETWKDANGDKQEQTEWHRVILWRKLAELAEQYLRKGSKVYIEGKLQTRKHEDDSGVVRYYTEVVAREMKFLSKSETAGSFPSADDAPPVSQTNAADKGKEMAVIEQENEDDLPF